jgi:hypothetical protein
MMPVATRPGHVNSLATPHTGHAPYQPSRTPRLTALERTRHHRGGGNDLWPRTVLARKLTTMGFLRHGGTSATSCSLTLHIRTEPKQTVKLSSSSPQVWLCSIGVDLRAPRWRAGHVQRHNLHALSCIQMRKGENGAAIRYPDTGRYVAPIPFCAERRGPPRTPSRVDIVVLVCSSTSPAAKKRPMPPSILGCLHCFILSSGRKRGICA